MVVRRHFPNLSFGHYFIGIISSPRFMLNLLKHHPHSSIFDIRADKMLCLFHNGPFESALFDIPLYFLFPSYSFFYIFPFVFLFLFIPMNTSMNSLYVQFNVRRKMSILGFRCQHKPMLETKDIKCDRPECYPYMLVSFCYAQFRFSFSY